MRLRPLVLATAASSLLLCSSCVRYVVYEDLQDRHDRMSALAASRRDSIAAMQEDFLATYRAKDQMEHEVNLLHSELSSTQFQYAQLRDANQDVVDRYHRSLTISTMENEVQFSARHRLTESALDGEMDALHAERRERNMEELLEASQTDNDEILDQRDDYREENRELRQRLNEPEPTDYSDLATVLGYRNLQRIEAYGTGLASVTDEGRQFVVRASEALCFRDGQLRLASTGKDFVRDVATLVKSAPELEILVHAISKREGSAARLAIIERQQSSAIVDHLVDAGVKPENVRALDDDQWGDRVTGEGSLGSRMYGEMVFVIHRRPDERMGMR